MNTRRALPLVVAGVVFAGGLWLQGAVPNVPTGEWLPGPSLAAPRLGAASVVLDDGRVLVIGGSQGGSPSAAVEVYDASGTIGAAAPLSTARSGHSAAKLADGRVLVIGGTSAVTTDQGIVEGPTTSVEAYDPLANIWYPVGSLSVARTGATATAVGENRVLVSGGAAGDGTVLDNWELWDATSGAVVASGLLSASRTEHAAAVAGNTTVLVVGGRNAQGVLATADVVDVETGSVASIVLTTPRAGATVTRLLDGTVLVLGGTDGVNDLSSAEIIDPAAGTSSPLSAAMAEPRRGAQATLLDNNNTVLITGGANGNALVATAEQFVPWRNEFRAALSPVVSRRGAVLASLPKAATGVALLAGGASADGTPAASSELYGFATIKTDRDDYAPGDMVTITGSGWQPGETVTLSFVEVPNIDTHPPLTALVREDGTFRNIDFAPDDGDLGVRFYLTATGVGSTAQMTFTDAQPNQVTVGGQTPSPLAAGNVAGYSVGVSFNGNSNNCTVSLSAATVGTWPVPPPGGFFSFANSSLTGNLSSSTTLAITTPATMSAGTYTFTVNANPQTPPCQNGSQVRSATGQLIISTATATTVSSSINPSTYGSPVNFTATVAALTGATTPTGTVQFKIDGNDFGSPVAVAGSGTTATATSGSISTLTVPTHTVSAVYTPTGTVFGTSTGTFTQTVNTKPLTVSGITANSRPYDGTIAATLNTGGAALVGVVAGDTVTLNTAGATGTFANKNPGANKTVTISGLTLGGASAGNYSLTPPTATASITAAPLTGSFTAQSRPYDGTTAAAILTRSLTGVLGTDDVTLTGGSASFDTKNVGVAKQVTGTGFTLSGADAGNYTLGSSTLTASADITSLTASVAPNAASKVYGDTDPAFTGTLTGFLPGDGITASYSRAAGETVAGSPYTISATLSPAAVLGNYTISYGTAAFTISARSASVTPNAATKVYGDADPLLTGSLTGFIAADGVAASYSRTLGETVAGGPYTVSGTLSPSGVLGNYSITYNTAAFTITPRSASVTPAGASKTYGDADPTLVGTLSGFVAADGVSAAYSRAAGETVAGGPYTITATLSPGGVLANYSITHNAANFTISARTASVTPNAGTKLYGDADPALSGTLAGFLASDSVTATYSRATGETVLGGPYSISATLSPAAVLGNYNVTYETANFTITPKAASVTPNAISKVYGDADPALTGTLTGFLASDSVTATYSRATGETVLGGPYAISATLSPAGVLGNYNVTYNTAEFSIAPKPASVTPNAATKMYGDAEPALTGTLTGFLAADSVTASYSRAAGETVLGGPYAVSAALSPAAVLGNYNVTYNTAEFSITPKPASVTPNAATKMYGDADPTLAGTLAGFLAADSVTATYHRTAGETVLGGPYIVSAILSPAGVLSNYDVTDNTAEFTITPRPASVTPNGGTKVYGEADPTFTGALSGFVAADAVTASYSRTTGETVAGSPYNISAILSPAGVLSNYNVSYSTAQFTITPKPASVTPNAGTKVYGEADPTFTGALTGFVAADAVTASYSRTTGETVAGSPYNVSAILSPAGVLGNYTITYNTAAFTIAARPASVTPNAATKVYGEADPTLSGELAGFVAGDGVAASYSRTAGEAVGGSPYSISATLSPAGVLGNYTITYNTAAFTIDKAVASVTPNAATKTYGAADPTFTGALSGFMPGDGVTATYTRTSGETVAGGPYTISATLAPTAALGNYDVTYNTALFTINKATASVTPNAATKIYGHTDPSFTGTLSGFVESDGVTAAYSRTAGELVNGSYTISATLNPAGALGNYTITYNTAAFTITRAAASVTPNAAGKIYGAADPLLTGTLAGFVDADHVTATYSRTAGEAVAGNPYTISATLSPAAALDNYDITYNTAVFTIGKATASVTPNAATKVYGLADPPFTGTLAGFVAGDSLTASYSRTAGNSVAGSPYTISATLGPAAVLGNYDITYNTAAFTITKAPLTVTVEDKTKLLNAANPPLTGTVTGVVGGDGITASYATAATTSSPIGSYPITATLNDPGGKLANYSVSNTAGTLKVGYAPLGAVCGGVSGHQILQPIDVAGTSVFKQKSTVPAKFRVCDANGAAAGSAGVVNSFRLVQRIAGTTVNTVNEVVDSTTPDMTFRWSATDQQWIFNINTKDLTANQTYVYSIELNDGSLIPFQFGLK